MYDVVVIGCGIIGSAVAYELSKYRLSIAVLEKENDVANATSKANSGIIHAGYDPEPGTLMARLNVEGAKLTEILCKDMCVPYKKIGSLVLAFDETELPMLQKLYERGIANGVSGLQILSGEQVLEMNPDLNTDVKGALYAPTAAIVNPMEYNIALAETAVRNGVEVILGNEVRSIEKTDKGFFVVKTNKGIYEAKYIFNAAGLHSDEVHNMVAEPEFQIKAVRGEYYLLDKAEGTRSDFVLFQCPTKEGKGVLVSPTVHGNLIVGPNAEDIVEKDNVSTTSQGLSYIKRSALKTIPNINFGESIRNFSGIRATTKGRDDFIIAEAGSAENFFDLAGIKSPGLSAAPAIAKEAVELLATKGIDLEKKKYHISTRKKIRFNELSVKEKEKIIMQKPSYGRVICRCETITEGEIIDAIHSPIVPTSIDGVKRRCNAGMGRCQGGFCGPRVLEIISRELNISPEMVVQDREGSIIITGETKTGGIADV